MEKSGCYDCRSDFSPLAVHVKKVLLKHMPSAKALAQALGGGRVENTDQSRSSTAKQHHSGNCFCDLEDDSFSRHTFGSPRKCL
jgi:hypothetical protein